MSRIRLEVPFRTMLFLAIVTLSIYFVFAFAQRTAQIYGLQQEETRLAREVRDLHARNAQLLQDRDGLQRDTDIEKVAREELNLIKPGETAVIVLPSNEVIARLQQEQAAAHDQAVSDAPRNFLEKLFSR